VSSPIGFIIYVQHQVSLDDKPLKSFRTKAVQALLIYLLCQPEEAHRREFLMTLLWPGLPQKSAQASLRQTIYLLRQAIPDTKSRDGSNSVSFLISDRQTIQINPEVTFDLDVSTFETLLAGPVEGWAEAVALYGGDFLAGFYLPDSAPFEEWVLARREVLRRRVLAALEKLAGLALASADCWPGAKFCAVGFWLPWKS